MSTNGWALVPQSYSELMQFAKLIADSDMVPKDFKGKPGNCIVAIQMGADIGLTPMQSLQNISVVNGRPTLWGDAGAAIVQRQGCQLIESVDDAGATCTLKRPGREDTTRTFSVDDAKKAGLWNKQGPWTQYPKRMLQMRARWFAMRDGAADLLKGFNGTEEQQDIVASVVDQAPSTARPARALESGDQRLGQLRDAVNVRSGRSEAEATGKQRPVAAKTPEVVDQPAPEPAPEPQAKHELYWALFKNSSHVGQKVGELQDADLANYIERLEKAVASEGKNKDYPYREDALLYLAVATKVMAARMPPEDTNASWGMGDANAE